MPIRRGHVAPQNSYIETIIRKFDEQNRNFLVGNAATDGSIIYCNEGFCRLTGFSRADVMQCPSLTEFLHGPSTSTEVVSQIKSALTLEEERQVQLLYYRKDGSKFLCNQLIYPVKNELGDVLMFLIQFEDANPSQESTESANANQIYSRFDRARQSFRQSFRIRKNSGKRNPIASSPGSRDPERPMEKIDSAEEAEDAPEISIPIPAILTATDERVLPAVTRPPDLEATTSANGQVSPESINDRRGTVGEYETGRHSPPPLGTELVSPSNFEADNYKALLSRRRFSRQRGSISLDESILVSPRLCNSNNFPEISISYFEHTPSTSSQQRPKPTPAAAAAARLGHEAPPRPRSSSSVTLGTPVTHSKTTLNAIDSRRSSSYSYQRSQRSSISSLARGTPRGSLSGSRNVLLLPRNAGVPDRRNSKLEGFSNQLLLKKCFLSVGDSQSRQSGCHTGNLRPTNSLDALTRHRISDIPLPWHYRSVSTTNNGRTASKSVPNACSDSDLSRYRTFLTQHRERDRKSPSLSIATTDVVKIKNALHPPKMGEKVAQ